MDEPIDLAQKAAEKGNPWFGLGNALTTPIAEDRGARLTLSYTAEGKRLMYFWHNQDQRRLAVRHRAERWQKIRKRQRRAAQRRHNHGQV